MFQSLADRLSNANPDAFSFFLWDLACRGRRSPVPRCISPLLLNAISPTLPASQSASCCKEATSADSGTLMSPVWSPLPLGASKQGCLWVSLSSCTGTFTGTNTTSLCNHSPPWEMTEGLTRKKKRKSSGWYTWCGRPWIYESCREVGTLFLFRISFAKFMRCSRKQKVTSRCGSFFFCLLQITTVVTSWSERMVLSWLLITISLLTLLLLPLLVLHFTVLSLSLSLSDSLSLSLPSLLCTHTLTHTYTHTQKLMWVPLSVRASSSI